MATIFNVCQKLRQWNDLWVRRSKVNVKFGAFYTSDDPEMAVIWNVGQKPGWLPEIRRLKVKVICWMFLFQTIPEMASIWNVGQLLWQPDYPGIRKLKVKVICGMFNISHNTRDGDHLECRSEAVAARLSRDQEAKGQGQMWSISYFRQLQRLRPFGMKVRSCVGEILWDQKAKGQGHMWDVLYFRRHQRWLLYGM